MNSQEPIRKSLATQNSPLPERWRGWARALNRRRQLAARFIPAALTFLRPRMFIQLLRASRRVSLSQHYAQLNLLLSLLVGSRLVQNWKARAHQASAPSGSPSRLLLAGVTAPASRPSVVGATRVRTPETTQVAADDPRPLLLKRRAPLPASQHNSVPPQDALQDTTQRISDFLRIAHRTWARLWGGEPPARRVRRRTQRCEREAPGRPRLVICKPESRPDSPAVSSSPDKFVSLDQMDGNGQRGWSRGAAFPSPAINVESLTDEVIRQIDRRIIARRERIGRV